MHGEHYCEAHMPLRLVTYNIWEGGGSRLPLIEQVLRQLRPDVVALQEANEHAAVQSLATRLEMELVYGEANCEASIAWLSRLPVAHSENHRLPQLSKTLLELQVTAGGRDLRLFATHLADRRQDAGQYPRLQEMQSILGVLSGPFSILVGDLNAVAPGDPVEDPPGGEPRIGDARPDAPRQVIGSLLEAGYVDCLRARHPKQASFTYDASRQLFLRLDYVFVLPVMAARLIDCRVVQTELTLRASDHVPVLATFSEGPRR
jgi:exodeoxyribonuclease III